MLIKDKKITEEGILRICKEREKWDFISFEEMYIKGKNYIPKLYKNV